MEKINQDKGIGSVMARVGWSRALLFYLGWSGKACLIRLHYTRY